MKYLKSYKLFESSNIDMDYLKDIFLSDFEDAMDNMKIEFFEFIPPPSGESGVWVDKELVFRKGNHKPRVEKIDVSLYKLFINFKAKDDSFVMTILKPFVFDIEKNYANPWGYFVEDISKYGYKVSFKKEVPLGIHYEKDDDTLYGRDRIRMALTRQSIYMIERI